MVLLASTRVSRSNIVQTTVSVIACHLLFELEEVAFVLHFPVPMGQKSSFVLDILTPTMATEGL